MKRSVIIFTGVCLCLVALYGACALRAAIAQGTPRTHRTIKRRPVMRYGSVIKVRPEKLAEYKKLHAAVWPKVLQMIHDCNIRNYTIFYRDGYLFSYFEYVGQDFKGDMARMAADPTTQDWWTHCKPCQQPVETAGPDDWWADMQEVFHTD